MLLDRNRQCNPPWAGPPPPCQAACIGTQGAALLTDRQTDIEGGRGPVSSSPCLLLHHLSLGQVRHVSAREDAGRPEESRSTLLNHCRGLLLCDGSASFSRSTRRTGRPDLQPASYKSTKRLPAAGAVGFSTRTHFYCHQNTRGQHAGCHDFDCIKHVSSRHYFFIYVLSFIVSVNKAVCICYH